MVTQFKDNPFAKATYELDKKVAQAEYKFAYYIPELNTSLENCLAQLNVPGDKSAFKNDLELIRNEISNELDIFGHDKFPQLENITVEKFDSVAYDDTRDFIGTLRRIYLSRFENAKSEKQQLIERFAVSPEKVSELRRQLDAWWLP